MDLLGRKAKRKLEDFAVVAARYSKFQDLKISDLTEQRNRLQQELLEAKLQIESLQTKPEPIRSQPLYLNETEEDIEYAYRNELINKAQYEDMLKQLEFDNTQITFDLEAY